MVSFNAVVSFSAQMNDVMTQDNVQVFTHVQGDTIIVSYIHNQPLNPIIYTWDVIYRWKELACQLLMVNSNPFKECFCFGDTT